MTLCLIAVFSAAPVVDIDGTFFVQGALFLLLMFVLKPLLFEPWLAVRERRARSIQGALRDAERLRTEADDLAQDHDARLAVAREQAVVMRSTSRRDEEAVQAEKLATVREQASRTLEADRKKIADAATRARQSLVGRVDELGKQISERILGRPG